MRVTTTTVQAPPPTPDEPVPAPATDAPPVVRDGDRTSSAPPLSASTSCPSAITITNDDVVEHRVNGSYSAYQTPLVSAIDGRFPAVAPGGSTSIDLTPARGQDNVQIFVDGFSHWVVDGVAC